LLPESKLHIIAEHYQRVRHNLLACEGASIDNIKIVRSHVHALSQCHSVIQKLNLEPQVHADTAGAAAELARLKDPKIAVIASTLAAQIYKLNVLQANVEDASHNTTRFVVLSANPINPDPTAGPVVTSFIFKVRNVPAALYKALAGFSTNSINMTKLESYMVDGTFTATQFFAEVEAHPHEKRMQLALEELAFFTSKIDIIGVYPAHPFRIDKSAS